MTKETKRPEALTDQDLDQQGGGFGRITLKKGYVVTADLQDWVTAKPSVSPGTSTIMEFQDGDDLILRSNPNPKQTR